MRKLLIACVLSFASIASAQELPEGHGPGIGIEQNLGGITGATFVYDAGTFHIDVLLGLDHISRNGPDSTGLGIAGRFFYVAHKMERADFGIGGGIGILRTELGDAHETNIELEAAAQIRVFVAPNVVALASLGLSIVTADNGSLPDGPIAPGGNGDTQIGLGGQLFGGFGVTYFFK
jgi:hypothetical protein